MEDTAPTIDERVVAGIGRQCHGRFSMRDGLFGAAGVHAEGGGRVEPWELGEFDGGGHPQELLGPANRLEPLQGPGHHARVRGDRRSEVVPVSVAQRNVARRLANSMSTQPSATGWPGRPTAPRVVNRLIGEVLGVPIAGVDAGPVGGKLVRCNWRIVSNIP